jgi:hypothetical protein
MQMEDEKAQRRFEEHLEYIREPERGAGTGI